MPSYQRLRVPRWMHGANARRLPVATTMTATVINERASTEPLSHRRPSWSGRTRHPHPRIARKGTDFGAHVRLSWLPRCLLSASGAVAAEEAQDCVATSDADIGAASPHEALHDDRLKNLIEGAGEPPCDRSVKVSHRPDLIRYLECVAVGLVLGLTYEGEVSEGLARSIGGEPFEVRSLPCADQPQPATARDHDRVS